MKEDGYTPGDVEGGRPQKHWHGALVNPPYIVLAPGRNKAPCKLFSSSRWVPWEPKRPTFPGLHWALLPAGSARVSGPLSNRMTFLIFPRLGPAPCDVTRSHRACPEVPSHRVLPAVHVRSRGLSSPPLLQACGAPGGTSRPFPGPTLLGAVPGVCE